MFYKIWFVYQIFWCLSWCVPDSILVWMWYFSNRKINFYSFVSFVPFLFTCSLVFFIYRGSFYRLFTEHRISLEAISPPATSVHQDDTLTYAVFVLETLNYFLLLAYVRVGVNNFVLWYCLKIQISWIHNLDLGASMDIRFSNNLDYHDNGMPKESYHRICLSVILNDSVFNIGKSYYS